jgi:hypothetical protein
VGKADAERRATATRASPSHAAHAAPDPRNPASAAVPRPSSACPTLPPSVVTSGHEASGRSGANIADATSRAGNSSTHRSHKGAGGRCRSKRAPHPAIAAGSR